MEQIILLDYLKFLTEQLICLSLMKEKFLYDCFCQGQYRSISSVFKLLPCIFRVTLIVVTALSLRLRVKSLGDFVKSCICDTVSSITKSNCSNAVFSFWSETIRHHLPLAQRMLAYGKFASLQVVAKHGSHSIRSSMGI